MGRETIEPIHFQCVLKKLCAWAKFRGLMVNPKQGMNSEGRPNHDKKMELSLYTKQMLTLIS